MPRGLGANFFSRQMTRAACYSSTSASSYTIISNGRLRRLTTVLICLPLGLITLILLCIFTSTDSAALSASQISSDRFSHPSFTNFNFSDAPLNPYPHPKSPRVFLKHNGESGMLRPVFDDNPVTETEGKNYYSDEESANENEHFEPKREYKQRNNNDYRFSQPAVSDENLSDRNSRATLNVPKAAIEASKPALSQFPEKHWMEFLVDQTTFPYVPQTQFQLSTQHNLDTNYSQQPTSQKSKFIFPSRDNKYFSQKETIPAAASPSPAYVYPYSLYSEEDLENVADFDDHHSKYFIKTKPKVGSAKINYDSIFNANIKRAIDSPFQSPRPSNHLLNQEDVVEHLLPYAKDNPIQSSSLQIHSDEYDDEDANGNISTNKNYIPVRHHKDFGGSPSQSNEEEENGGEDLDSDSDVISDSTTAATTTSTTSSPEIKEPEAKTSAVPSKTTTMTTIAPTLDLSSSASALSDYSSSTATNNLITDVTSKYGTTDATSIPGMPGIDYPILDEVPYTGFDCSKQRYKGFFADIDTKCQAWHYCDFTDGHSTFLCPNGTLFSQVLLTCDWWFNVDCKQAQQLYVLNERLYRYIKPPKPSFPEDYSGPQVDRWLIEQLQLGTYPKMKKKTKDKMTQPFNN